MKIIGLDPGYASFGIAVADLTVTGARFEQLRVVTTKPSAQKRTLRKADDMADRLAVVGRELRRFVGRDVVALCVEATVLPHERGIQTSVVSGLGRARGLVDMLALEYGLPVIEEFPQTLKLITTGKRNATKEEIRTALERLHPELAALWPARRGDLEHAGDAAASVIAGLQSDVVRAVLRARSAMGGEAQRDLAIEREAFKAAGSA